MRIGSKCNTKERHQTTRKREQEKKEQRITTKQPPNNQMSIGIYLYIFTLHKSK